VIALIRCDISNKNRAKNRLFWGTATSWRDGSCALGAKRRRTEGRPKSIRSAWYLHGRAWTIT